QPITHPVAVRTHRPGFTEKSAAVGLFEETRLWRRPDFDCWQLLVVAPLQWRNDTSADARWQLKRPSPGVAQRVAGSQRPPDAPSRINAGAAENRFGGKAAFDRQKIGRAHV